MFFYNIRDIIQARDGEGVSRKAHNLEIGGASPPPATIYAKNSAKRCFCFCAKIRLMWHVYLLLCKDKSIYTGITKDLRKRFAAHRAGTGAKYTRAKGVRRILYSERFRTMSAAMKREAAIKKLSRPEKQKLTKRPLL